MGDSGKPFACPEIGCNQRFVNEDHLEVHRRKHEMSLGLRDLKSLDTPVIADQTPTPTRFLKNCEEVGLFNEPPNPFDALFRKASIYKGSDASEPASAKSEGDLPVIAPQHVAEIETVASEQVVEEASQQAVSSTTGDETQQLEEVVIIEDNQVIEVTTVSSVAQNVLPVVQQAPVSIVQAVPAIGQKSHFVHSVQVNANTIPITGPILLRLSTGQTIPVIPPSVSNPEVPIPVAISAVPRVSVVVAGGTNSIPMDSKSVKQKLKRSLLTNQSQGNMGVMTQAVDVVTRQQGMVNEPHFDIINAASPGSQEGQIKRRRRNSDMSSDEKREKFLERNRAAATRCRNKRKTWVTNLQQEAEEMHATKNNLLAEVNKLREEVAHLKQLLLAHNECPVTLLQRQVQGRLLSDTSGSGDGPASPQAELVAHMEEVKPLLR